MKVPLTNQRYINRACYNLVENAVKYNTSGGQVEIRAVLCAGQSVVTVAGTGIGIPAEQRELTFEPFYRVDKSRSRQMGGAGLGLATVKAILDKHSGTISVTENMNGGSVFTVTLPQ